MLRRHCFQKVAWYECKLLFNSKSTQPLLFAKACILSHVNTTCLNLKRSYISFDNASLICKSHIAMMESMNMVTATDSITNAMDVFITTITTDLVTEGMYYTLKCHDNVTGCICFYSCSI